MSVWCWALCCLPVVAWLGIYVLYARACGLCVCVHKTEYTTRTMTKICLLAGPGSGDGKTNANESSQTHTRHMRDTYGFIISSWTHVHAYTYKNTHKHTYRRRRKKTYFNMNGSQKSCSQNQLRHMRSTKAAGRTKAFTYAHTKHLFPSNDRSFVIIVCV